MKVRLRLSFGRHHDAHDGEELAHQIADFEPHVYVQETANLVEDERESSIRARNKSIERARRDPRERAALLDDLRSRHRLGYGLEYTLGEAAAIVDAYRLAWFSVEAYPPDVARRHFEAGARSVADAEPVNRLLAAGRVREAIALHGEAHDRFARTTIVPRNDRIARGFGTLEVDLARFFPRLARAPEVRVLARFGLAHGHLASRLRTRPALEIVGPEPAFTDAVIVRVCADSTPVSFDEATRILFFDLFGTLAGGTAMPHGQAVAAAKASLDRIGGEAAFVAWLEDTTRQHATLDDLVVVLRKRLRA